MPRKRRPNLSEQPPDKTAGLQASAVKKPGQRFRCTKAEKDVRLRKLMRLSEVGYGTDALEEYAIENFGILRQMARKYVNEMLDMLEDSVSIYDKRRIAGVVLKRSEFCYRMAASQRNVAGMIAANGQMAMFFVRAAPSITPPVDATPPEDDPEEDF